MARETKLGNPALEKAVAETGDPDLKQALDWSRGRQRGDRRHGPRRAAVSRTSASAWSASPARPTCSSCSPRPTRRSKPNGRSTTWRATCVAICGQEVGTKKESLAAAKKYPPNHALMIGDAPGDYKAAVANNCLFFPINPGDEEASWKRLLDEGIDRFFDGTFAGDYQKQLLDEFDTLPARAAAVAGR